VVCICLEKIIGKCSMAKKMNIYPRSECIQDINNTFRLGLRIKYDLLEG